VPELSAGDPALERNRVMPQSGHLVGLGHGPGEDSRLADFQGSTGAVRRLQDAPGATNAGMGARSFGFCSSLYGPIWPCTRWTWTSRWSASSGLGGRNGNVSQWVGGGPKGNKGLT